MERITLSGFNRRQYESELFVWIIARSSYISGNILCHFGMRSHQLIGVFDGQGGHIIGTVVIHSLSCQHASAFGHSHDELPDIFVISHADGIALIFFNIIVVCPGFGEFKPAEDAFFAGLNLHFRRIRYGHFAGKDSRTIVQFCLYARDCEGEFLIRVIGGLVCVTDNFLGYFRLRGHLVVGQDGQNHQRGGIVACRAFGHGHGLPLSMRTFVPAGGNGFFYPAVFVPDAVFVHLFHTDGNVGPVVGLFQSDAGLAGHGLPVGSDSSRLFICGNIFQI